MPQFLERQLGVGRSWVRGVLLCCLALLLSGFLLIQPVLAQASTELPKPAIESSEKVGVLVDGRMLLRLGNIDGVTAAERANLANDVLREAIQKSPLDEPILVNIVQRDELTTIRVQNQHLLTVTKRDFVMGMTAREQAEKWAGTLRKALQQAQKERQPTYYRDVLAKAIVALIAVIAGTLVIRWIRRRIWRRWAKKLSSLSYRRRLVPLGFVCTQYGLWVAWAFYVCELFPRARIMRYRLFWFLGEIFTNPLLTISGQAYSLLDVAKLVSVAVALFLLVRGLTAIVRTRVLQTLVPDRGMQDALATLMQFGLTGLGLFILLQAWGIDLRALAIFASVLGVGLGFGLQNIANNFISGWILLIERPVRVGDFVKLGDLMGTVERIGARSTEIRTPDRVSIIVPNAELVETRVVNWSHHNPVSRLHLNLGVAYGSSIDIVHQAVLEAAHTHPEVLRHPQPRLRFVGFGESSLDFDLMVWLRDPRHQFDLKSDLYYLLEANLRRYQIEIPFPQRDLNLRSPALQSMLSSLDTEGTTELLKPSRVQGGATDLLSNIRDYSAILQSSPLVTDDEIDRLIQQMRGPGGLEIDDRRFRLTTHPSCFVGSEAVTWIVRTQNATREAAVQLGQRLLDLGIIHHVADEHPFRDEYLFYRFYDDEP